MNYFDDEIEKKEQEEYMRRKRARKKRLMQEERKRKKKLRRTIILSALAAFVIAILLILKLIIGFIGSLTKEEEPPEVEQPKEPQVYNASIISAGDLVPHSPFIDSTIYKQADGSYDYSPIFTYIKDNYASADYAILNLECTISDGDYSGHPLFRTPDAMTKAIAENGIDMCLLANNHIYDNFDDGLTLTSNALDNFSLDYAGVRNSTEAKTYTVKDINGIKVGIFNYTYETEMQNGQKTINALPVSSVSAPLINSFNYGNLDSFYETIQSDMASMKTDGVEYTIAYIHWGNEYELTESDIQNEMAQKLCDLGIDMLIGSHPHCVQPVDLLTSNTEDHKMVCLYSVGNHVSNQLREYIPPLPNGHSEDGLMVKINLEQTDDGPVSLTNVEFLPTWTFCRKTDDGSSEYFILPVDNPGEVKEKTSDLNTGSEIDESLSRTTQIINDGVEKVTNALPITNK